MSEKQSNGSKLGAIAGLVITLVFFLPWVRSCGVDMSGYDIATNSQGNVEDSWMYWGTLVAGVVCIALFFLVRADNASRRIQAAVARLIAGLVGFLPILNIWSNVKRQGDSLEVLYGGWIIALGYLGIFVSFFMDLGGTTDEPEQGEYHE